MRGLSCILMCSQLEERRIRIFYFFRPTPENNIAFIHFCLQDYRFILPRNSSLNDTGMNFAIEKHHILRNKISSDPLNSLLGMIWQQLIFLF